MFMEIESHASGFLKNTTENGMRKQPPLSAWERAWLDENTDFRSEPEH